MAEDPRIESVERHIWKGAQAAVTSSVRPHTIGSLRRAAREALAELDAADPLRALLADEGRLLEITTKARYEATRRQALLPAWEDAPEWSKRAWAAGTTTAAGPVLAALREVAGLTHCAACHRPLPHSAPELTACQTAREVANDG